MHCIVERIEQQRKKLNISQKELCQKCDIIDTTYSSWKNRNRLPSIDDIQKIALELHTSLEWLITGTDNATPLPSAIQPDEQQLLQFYNQSSQEGKGRIMEQAEFISHKYPAVGKLSEYKIG